MTEFQVLHEKWLNDDPAYAAEYRAMEPEFAVARELIRARNAAGMTQEQAAERMGTKQTVVARLESGRAKPSTRTLERYAEATGRRLKISLEPA
jgi:ribosome-binding protein aMBF1 (putative translation factor)